MRLRRPVILSALISVVCCIGVDLAVAQCGVSADARGGGASPGGSNGSLCRFGEAYDGNVQPAYGGGQRGRNAYDPYFSPQEHRQMTKQLYQKYRQGPGDGFLSQSVNRSTRALRQARR
jgi:hypothetical protein